MALFLLLSVNVENIIKMKKVITILAVAFVILQFFQIDKTNPPVNKEVDFLTVKKTPETVATNIRNACYDCHSNETKYPWYSNIQPVAWLLKDHIDNGRKELNFSTFATYEARRQTRKMEEAAELVQNGAMPMDSYLLMHPEAKLTAEQKAEMIQYFKSLASEIPTTDLKTNYPEDENNESEEHH